MNTVGGGESGERAGRWDLPILVGVLGLAGLGALVFTARTGQFTWDEAVYASQARSLVSDIPSAFWAAYRPPALPLIGTVAVLGDFGELSIRAITLVLGLAAIAMGWAFAAHVWGRVAAVLTLLAVVASPAVLGELRQFHNDLPAAGLLFALMILLWDQFERRPAPDRVLLLAGPLAAAAFYVRFGTLVAIAAIVGTGLMLWWPKLRSRPALVAAAAVVGLVLFIPHAFEAIQRTGSPIGIVTRAADVAGQEPVSQQIRRYLLQLPGGIAGPLPTLLLLAGGIRALQVGLEGIRGRNQQQVRRMVWTLLPALATAPTTILASHYNPRFLLFPLILGFVAGAAGLAVWLPALARRLAERGSHRAAGAAVLGAGLVLAGAAAFTITREVAEALGSEPPDIRASAGRRIAADAAGSPCHLASSGPPVHAWYSRCAADPLVRAGEALDRPSGWKVYLVFREAGDRETDPQVIDALRAVVETEGWRQLPAAVPDDGHEIFVRP